MPPCAAMEWARRGESWKQKDLTLYPNSPSVAAAEAPASPVPTIMTLYFRLLAGFTSFISNLARSHFCSMGPAGMRASSFIVKSSSLHDTHHHGNGHRTKSYSNQDGKHGRRLLEDWSVARMRNAQRLKR